MTKDEAREIALEILATVKQGLQPSFTKREAEACLTLLLDDDGTREALGSVFPEHVLQAHHDLESDQNL